jgi:hypothetical protein
MRNSWVWQSTRLIDIQCLIFTNSTYQSLSSDGDNYLCSQEVPSLEPVFPRAHHGVLPSHSISLGYILILFSRPYETGQLGIATSYELHGRSSILHRGKRFFSTPQCPDRLCGPSTVLSNGYRELLPPEEKQPVREHDHSPLSSAEDKSGGAIPPLLDLHGVMLN